MRSIALARYCVLFSVSTIFLITCHAADGSDLMLHSISLKGEALGGELVFYQIPLGGDVKRMVRVQTTRGESASDVVQRISDQIRQRNPFGWHSSSLDPSARPGHADGAALVGIPGGPDGLYVFGGSEAGLGIPSPPRSLSIAQDSSPDELKIVWSADPDTSYDHLVVSCNGPMRSERLSGDARSTVLSISKSWPYQNKRDLSVTLVGYRDGIPSNAAVIRYFGGPQQEYMGTPFAGGVAPNWMRWTRAVGDNDAFQWKEAARPDKSRGDRYYQRLCGGKAGAAGTWRCFGGLTSGKTYRLSGWVCTGDMPADQDNWSFSFHAAPVPDMHIMPTPEQLNGESPLPGGAVASACRIARFGPEARTSPNHFDLATTDPAKPVPGRTVSDITLPAGATAVLIWTRYESANGESSGVGFGQLRLEEVWGAP